MKILIADDEPLARERIREMLKNDSEIVSINEAANGEEALNSIKTGKPDIVFLDIQMPGMDGFEVLENLDANTLRQIPAIVFVTAYDQYALRAFEFHALDYLLKPFDRERFDETLRRAKASVKKQDGEMNKRIVQLLEQINNEPEFPEWLTIKKDERIKLLKIEDIEWIEAQGNYALLKFKESSEMLRETMDKLEAQLNPRTFVRIHRSTIVNINHIKELQVWSRGEYRVMMSGGKAFILSRSYRSRFDDFIKNRIVTKLDGK